MFITISEPLSARVARSRWRMLGHVLRGPTDGPAYSSLRFAVNTLQLQGRRGRISLNRISLNSLQDLDYLRNILLKIEHNGEECNLHNFFVFGKD